MSIRWAGGGGGGGGVLAWFVVTLSSQFLALSEAHKCLTAVAERASGLESTAHWLTG